MKYKFQDGGNTWSQMANDPEPINEESTEQDDNPEEDQNEDEQDQAYQEDPLYNEFVNQDYLGEDADSMSVINMVLNDEVSGKNNDFSLGWLNTKDKSVNIGGTSSKLSQYLNSLPENIKNELIATSGNDSSVHMKGSKHDTGEAVDFRYNKEVYNYMLNDPLFKQLNLNIPNPNHGTAPHIHLEQREFGGDLPPVSVTSSSHKRLPNGQIIPTSQELNAPQQILGNSLNIAPASRTTGYKDEQLLDYDGNLFGTRRTESPTTSRVTLADGRAEYIIPNNEFNESSKLGIEKFLGVKDYEKYKVKKMKYGGKYKC